MTVAGKENPLRERTDLALKRKVLGSSFSLSYFICIYILVCGCGCDYGSQVSV